MSQRYTISLRRKTRLTSMVFQSQHLNSGLFRQNGGGDVMIKNALLLHFLALPIYTSFIYFIFLYIYFICVCVCVYIYIYNALPLYTHVYKNKLMK